MCMMCMICIICKALAVNRQLRDEGWMDRRSLSVSLRVEFLNGRVRKASATFSASLISYHNLPRV